jgi:hypothetical protein
MAYIEMRKNCDAASGGIESIEHAQGDCIYFVHENYVDPLGLGITRRAMQVVVVQKKIGRR